MSFNNNQAYIIQILQRRSNFYAKKIAITAIGR